MHGIAATDWSVFAGVSAFVCERAMHGIAVNGFSVFAIGLHHRCPSEPKPPLLLGEVRGLRLLLLRFIFVSSSQPAPFRHNKYQKANKYYLYEDYH
jgi:hypothetical protein